MKKILLLITVFIVQLSQAQIYKSVKERSTIDFFSATPVEDIKAKSTSIDVAYNPKNQKVAYKVSYTSFKFPNALMEEHFNENYMESEKYKNSTFVGDVIEKIDLTQNGTYKVTVNGILDIHGVKKERKIPATITVKNNVLNFFTEFNVLLEDHDIKIPRLIIKKIAKSIKVTVNTELAVQ